jgi:hypothetical protein
MQICASVVHILLPKHAPKHFSYHKHETFFFSKIVRLWNVLNALITAMVARILLIIAGLETNPGPTKKTQRKGTLEFITYNVRGLGNPKKATTLFNELNRINAKNPKMIAVIQETHIDDFKKLSFKWRPEKIGVSGSGASCGVATILGADWKVTEDGALQNDARTIFCVVEDKTDPSLKIIIGCIYAPNEKNQVTIDYFEKVFNKLELFTQKYPQANIILAGDFNIPLYEDECITRQFTRWEKNMADTIVRNCEMYGLSEAHRSTRNKEGTMHTFKRPGAGIFSTIDRIFTNFHQKNILKSQRNWGTIQSDHAMLTVTVDLESKTVRGPGLTKLNVRTLENASSIETIENEFRKKLENVPQEWDPHMILDYSKAVFSGIVCELNKKTKLDTKTKGDDLKEELDRAHQRLEQLQAQKADPKVIERLVRSISNIETEIDEFVNKKGEFLARLSRSKWYQEGEKSNKYFFNILAYRQSQKNIEVMENEQGDMIEDQEQIKKLITDFYRNLYSKEENNIEDAHPDLVDEFFKNVPTLSEANKLYMDEPLTLAELSAALKTCKNTTPGPDGISYDFYKKYWEIWGNIILNSWTHSLKTGRLACSNLTSVITLLPKEGKDTNKISNWRPISLTNCDLKIVTKAYALRLAQIADTIIHPNQTAYVPGRSVMDNLRTIKEIARNNGENTDEALIISLDAKKAFDSVGHNYIRTALRKYGFGEGFINVFNTLYTDLKARILINGWQSEMIEILKGVKQGDALSCILFIICIDPLIRNINLNDKIKEINLHTNLGELKSKAFGYADDVSACIKNCKTSVQEVFNEYEILTKLSNLALNADKTEIVHFRKNFNRNWIVRSSFPIPSPALRALILSALRAHPNSIPPPGGIPNQNQNSDPITTQGSSLDANTNSNKSIEIDVYYNGRKFKINTINSLKICGIAFSNDPEIAYKLNIRDKIDKMTKQLNRWKARNLTLLGKILIVKTFGLSQIIYSMQCCEIEDSELREIENKILAYIWNKKEGNKRFTERIKRNIIYKHKNAGGFAAINPFTLDKALKIRAVMRASEAHHPIKLLQGSVGPFQPVYAYDELITARCKNYLTEIAAKQLLELGSSNTWINKLNLCELYKLVDAKGMSVVYAKQCNKVGLSDLKKVYIAAKNKQHPMHMKAKLALKWAEDKLDFITNKIDPLTTCDSILKIERENYSLELTHTTPSQDIRKMLDETMNEALIPYDPSTKYKNATFDSNRVRLSFQNISKITSVRTKNAVMRAIHGDIYTYERMHRYKMVDTNECPRCGQIETKEHLLLECIHSWNIWTKVFKYIDVVNKTNTRPTIENILNLNHNNDSRPNTNIIAHFLHNIMYFRPKDMSNKEVTKRIQDIIFFENNIKPKTKTHKARWDKWYKTLYAPETPEVGSTR